MKKLLDAMRNAWGLWLVLGFLGLVWYDAAGEIHYSNQTLQVVELGQCNDSFCKVRLATKTGTSLVSVDGPAMVGQFASEHCTYEDGDIDCYDIWVLNSTRKTKEEVSDQFE